MKKLLITSIMLFFFLMPAFGKNSIVYAQNCVPATGGLLLCNEPTYKTRCPIGYPGGGSPGGVMCCTTESECDKQQQTANQTRIEAAENENPILCDDKKGLKTAIGCIPTDMNGFIKVLMTFGVGIAGGIAFLLILLGGFQILTSAGNPEQLNAGKELVSSAITGLLLIVFSVFFLKIIGVDILGIPEWK